MNETLKKIITSSVVLGATITVLTFAGRYLIGQEVKKEVGPVKEQVANILFEKRYDEAVAADRACRLVLAEDYCDKLDEWRWTEFYPYLDCIAGVPRGEWEEHCGPTPEPPAPPEEE